MIFDPERYRVWYFGLLKPLRITAIALLASTKTFTRTMGRVVILEIAFLGVLLSAFKVWTALLTSVFLASGISPVPAVAAGEGVGLDPTIPARYTLGACASDEELDCIQSVAVLVGDELFEAQLAADIFRPLRLDNLGNLNRDGSSRWIAKTIEGDIPLIVNADLHTPTHACCIFPGNVVKRFGSLRTGIQVEDPLNTKVRIQIRTSWLKPLNVAMSMGDADFSQTPVPSGNLWTIQGTGLRVSAYDGDFAQKLRDGIQADSDEVWFRFVIDHAGESDELSPYPITCSEFGYTVASQNSSAAGKPSWNQSDMSLDFNIFAPHLRADGSLNKGYFRFWGHLDYFDCLYPGNSIRGATSVKVQVFNEDGEIQVATVVGSVKEGLLVVDAFDFHYSSPTIKASLNRPLTRTLTKFSGTNKTLTSKQKSQIKSILAKVKNNPKFICTGVYTNDKDRITAIKRARAACDYARSLDKNHSYWSQAKKTSAKSYDAKVMITSK